MHPLDLNSMPEETARTNTTQALNPYSDRQIQNQIADLHLDPTVKNNFDSIDCQPTDAIPVHRRTI